MFLGLMVEHFCVMFGDPSCIGFWDIVWYDRQTNENPAHAIAVGIENNEQIAWR